MGCNNSDTLPEHMEHIRRTNSKIAPEKETSTEKKIAKNFKTFQEFVAQLKIMLKEDGFYDYLFRAEYFEEMLGFITSSYVNHHETMKIISIVLQYMALTKNFINGRHVLKTNFKLDTLATQLSERWTEIRAEVFYANKNVLKVLNYLARGVDEKKSWFPHSYLDLKFDLSIDETLSVAMATKELCRYEERAFFYFSNYLLKSCQNEYKKVEAVTLTQAKLIKVLQEVSANSVKPLPLNGQELLFEHHQNFKANTL